MLPSRVQQDEKDSLQQGAGTLWVPQDGMSLSSPSAWWSEAQKPAWDDRVSRIGRAWWLLPLCLTQDFLARSKEELSLPEQDACSHRQPTPYKIFRASGTSLICYGSKIKSTDVPGSLVYLRCLYLVPCSKKGEEDEEEDEVLHQLHKVIHQPRGQQTDQALQYLHIYLYNRSKCIKGKHGVNIFFVPIS